MIVCSSILGLEQKDNENNIIIIRIQRVGVHFVFARKLINEQEVQCHTSESCMSYMSEWSGHGGKKSHPLVNHFLLLREATVVCCAPRILFVTHQVTYKEIHARHVVRN
jgi:hypothetical protein